MRVYLETDRLRLRQFTMDDADLLVELDADPEVMRYLTGGSPTPPEMIRNEIIPRLLKEYERYDDDYGLWAAVERATGEFLGWFAFRHHREPTRSDGTVRVGIELGYRLRRAVWGRGYATEGSRALVRRGFTELGVERVYAETMTVNTRSRRVMEKVGLRYVRTFHLDWGDPIPGGDLGDVEYALTRSDWQP